MTLTLPFPPLRRALLHPLWLSALAVLALNDHVLKTSGWLPGWFTGKLSDVAGLFVAPLLLAVLLRVRGPRMWMLAHIAIGAVFAGIQVSAELAQGWSALMGWVGFPWVITRDVTDLLAMPTLVVSYVSIPKLARATHRRLRRSTDIVVTSTALLCCVATSRPGSVLFTPFEGTAYLHNDNFFDIVIRVRPLKPTTLLDCDLIEEDPGAYLDESLFGTTQSWTLQPDATMSVLPESPFENRACAAALIDADNLPPTIVFWRENQIQTSQIQGIGISASAPGWISIQYDDDGRGTYEAELDILFPPPASAPRPQGICVPTSEAVRLAWTDVDAGSWYLGDVDEGIDGCVQMLLRTGFEHEQDRDGRPWTLCLPPGVFPFRDGDRVDLRAASIGDPAAGGLETSVQIQALDALVDTPRSDGAALIATRGPRLTDVFGMRAVVNSEYDCEPHSEPSCGTLRRPASITLSGGGYDTTSVRVAEAPVVTDSAQGDRLQLFLVHASERFALDPECASGPDALGADLELVAVRGSRGEE